MLKWDEVEAKAWSFGILGRLDFRKGLRDRAADMEIWALGRDNTGETREWATGKCSWRVAPPMDRTRLISR